MSDIKPAEVSAILKKQLSDLSLDTQLEEVGTVLTVGDGIARVYGLNNAQSGELVEFDNGDHGIVQNLEEDNVGIVMLGEVSTINEGDVVKRTRRIASLPVGEGLIGRVINTIGQPIDGKGPIVGDLFDMPLERKAPGVIYRQPVEQPLQTGIKAIDSMIPIGRGQRELIIGDRQTGKTAIAIDTIINQKYNYDAGEPVTGVKDGRPLLMRRPDSAFNIRNLARSLVYSCVASLKAGMDILTENEHVALDRIYAHGGFFKTPFPSQNYLSAALGADVTLMKTAGEGGASGIALLAAYMAQKRADETLESYLSTRVFADMQGTTVSPDKTDTDGLNSYMKNYISGLSAVRAAVSECTKG